MARADNAESPVQAACDAQAPFAGPLQAGCAAVARLIPPTARETRSCGRGCKGHRGYQRARAATSSPRHWVLTRRSLYDPDDLAFSYCQAPAGRAVPCPS